MKLMEHFNVLKNATEKVITAYYIQTNNKNHIGSQLQDLYNTYKFLALL